MTSQKQLSRLLFLISAAFILYGTTIPFTFNLSPQYLAFRMHRINWYPLLPGYSNSLFDDVQNILLFLPFGFLGWIAVRDKTQLWKALALVVMGGLLSTFVESLQVLSDTRTPAFSDIVFNTLGAAFGVLAALGTRHYVHSFSQHAEVRAFAASEAVYPTLVFAALVLVGELAPFDFTLDFGQFKHKLHQLLLQGFHLEMPSDDLVFMGRQLLCAVFLGRLLRQRDKGHPIWRAVLAGLITSVFGVALEGVQLIVSSRGPTFQDALILVIGSLIGAALVPVLGWRKRPFFAAVLTYVSVVSAIAMKELYPFHLGEWQGHFNAIPFLAEYANTSFLSLARFIEDSIAWVPLGFCWAYLMPKQKGLFVLTLVAALLASIPLELLQGFIPGRYPDTTDMISAGLGAMAGNLLLTRGKRAFIGYLTTHEEIAQNDQRQL
jgi:glycopeptide antibiotics resistance protein